MCIASYNGSWLCSCRTSILSVGVGPGEHSHFSNTWVIENAKIPFINSARKRVIIVNAAENLDE